MRNPQSLQDDIEWLESCIVTAEQYTQDIYDVVSTVKQVHMLEHNRNYTNAIKSKIEDLRGELKTSSVYFSEDDDV